MGDAPTQSTRAPGVPESDTAPCVGCGLCCDGTIYPAARAQPEERERLTQAGLVYFVHGGKSWFEHPCRFSKKGRCTIYHQERFAVCSRFRCKLLRAYQSGEIDREQAREKVRHALELRTAVTERAPGAARWRPRQELRQDLESNGRDPALLLRIIALDYYMDKWFRKPKPHQG